MLIDFTLPTVWPALLGVTIAALTLANGLGRSNGGTRGAHRVGIGGCEPHGLTFCRDSLQLGANVRLIGLAASAHRFLAGATIGERVERD